LSSGVRLTWLAALAATVALAAACGDDDGGDQASSDASAAGSAEGEPPFEARVEITKDGYRPRHVRILVGGTVTFVNVDKTGSHTAETGDISTTTVTDSNEFDTHTLTWEEPYTITFHKPEKVKYYDALSDMTGTVEAVPRTPPGL
jgi:plastocyanin